jgi:ribonuclease J
MQDELVLVPLGGAGEIGMNLYLYGYGPAHARKWIMVDLGISFPGPEMPGVEIMMPDPAFIEEERENLLGIVLTHAHEDHYGAISHLWPRLRVPVYATRFSAVLLQMRLAETDFSSEVPVHIVKPGARFDLGPFNIEYIPVTHSIPESNALAIRTKAGNILHSGDWRIDDDPVMGKAFDPAPFKALGDERCRALICDSTNILSPGSSPSETRIGKNLEQAIKEARGRVAVTTFASNAGRLLSVMRAAQKTGRHVVLAGRSMKKIVEAAREARCFEWQGELLTEDDYGYLPPEKVLLLCTGSQGEARAALSRIASGTHPRISLNAGDLVIFSSKTIPGNEREIGAVENNLADLGVDVLYSTHDFPVHVTGHPKRGEVERLYQWLRPEAAIPVHGEALHLVTHEKFARSLGVSETAPVRNGTMVRLAPGPLQIIDEVPSGRLCVDGRIIMQAMNGPLRERRKVSFVGAVIVFLCLDARGKVADDPQVEIIGLPELDRDGTAFEDIIFDSIDDALDGLPRVKRKSDAVVTETLRRAVRGAITRAWGKKTDCRIVLARV